MDKIIDDLIIALTNGDVMVVCIVIAVALIFNIGNITDFLDNRKKNRISFIKESLEESRVTGNTKLFLESLLEQEYFRLVTGVFLEKEIREALIKTHSDTKGELNFKHFKRAVPYITYKENTIGIKIDWFSLIGAIYSFVVGISSVAIGIILFVLPAFSSINFMQLLSVYGIGILLIAFGVLMLIQSLPVVSAKYVKNELEKLSLKAI